MGFVSLHLKGPLPPFSTDSRLTTQVLHWDRGRLARTEHRIQYSTASEATGCRHSTTVSRVLTIIEGWHPVASLPVLYWVPRSVRAGRPRSQ